LVSDTLVHALQVSTTRLLQTSERQFVQSVPGSTVTVKQQLLAFPQRSVATHSIVLVVFGSKSLPLGGVQATVQLLQQASVADG
jgi:hypothetical protein